MNNRLMFEGRFLVSMAGAIIRQDALRPSHGRVDWERIYRVADYHKITNIVYLSMLGGGKKIAPKWQESFAERYRQALNYSEICGDAEKEILTLMDMRKISCVILESCEMRNLYQLPETAGNSPLRILLDEGSYSQAKGYLIDLGYETDRFYSGVGERMKGASGFRVEIYRKMPFRIHIYEKQMQQLLRRASVKAPYHTIHTLSFEDRFIFYMAQCAWKYAADELVIRDLMNLYLYHRAWQEHIRQEHVHRALSAFRVELLADKILHLAYMWFGSLEELKLEEDRRQEPDDYDVLENRIFNRSSVDFETDRQATMLQEQIHKNDEREKRQEQYVRWKQRRQEQWENFLKKLRWAFPEYRYMCTIYPVLEKVPPLLPVCWIARLFRFLLP